MRQALHEVKRQHSVTEEQPSTLGQPGIKFWHTRQYSQLHYSNAEEEQGFVRSSEGNNRTESVFYLFCPLTRTRGKILFTAYKGDWRLLLIWEYSLLIFPAHTLCRCIILCKQGLNCLCISTHSFILLSWRTADEKCVGETDCFYVHCIFY